MKRILYIFFSLAFTAAPLQVFGAEIVWTQTDWSGGAGTSSINQYESADDINTTIPGELRLKTQTHTVDTHTLTVTAGDEIPHHRARNVADADDSTYWESHVIPAWVQLELDEARLLSRIDLVISKGKVSEHIISELPVDFRIDISQTGAFAGQEVRIAEVTGNTEAGTKQFLFDPTPVRFVKLTITRVPEDGTGHVEIRELVLYTEESPGLGTLVSSVFDAGTTTNWTTLSFDGNTTSTSAVTFMTRTGANTDALGSFQPLNESAIQSPNGQFIQYKVEMSGDTALAVTEIRIHGEHEKDRTDETPECSIKGLYGLYYNLPNNHPDVEKRITGIIAGTAPSDYDWFDESFLSFKRNDAIDSFNNPDNYFPVDNGLDGDPYHFAVHWTGSVYAANTGRYPVIIGSDDDSWVFINDKEVLNLGGTHAFVATTTTLELSAGTSTVDIYFAERHTRASGFQFIPDEQLIFSPCIERAEENRLPVFTGPQQATTTVATLLEFTVTAGDPDGDALVITANLPHKATYATSTGLFAWIPEQTGTSTATFFAFDGTGTSTHETFITVMATSTEINLPPLFIDFAPPTTATVHELYSYDAEAVDPEGDPISFSLLEEPAGMTIATSTGIIEWIPDESQASSTPYEILIEAKDLFGKATSSFSITVLRPSDGANDDSGTGGNGGGTPPSPPAGHGIILASQAPGAGGGGPRKTELPKPSQPAQKEKEEKEEKTSTSASDSAPLKTTPKKETPIKPPAEIQPKDISITETPEVKAQTTTPAGGRSFAALLFAGLLKNFLRWLRAHCCLLLFILWLLTLLAFILYILRERKKRKSIEGMSDTTTPSTGEELKESISSFPRP